MSRIVTALTVLLAVAGAVQFVRRESALREQRNRGFPASPNEADGRPHALAVFAVGDSYLTFDSSEADSSLWLVRSNESLRSWIFPPPVRPLSFSRLIQWKAPGKIVWALPGRASADFLLEFAGDSGHRLAVLRVYCAEGGCRTTIQDRVLPAAKLVVNADGTAVILDDKNFVVFRSIADLMRDNGATVARLSPPQENELLAQSRDGTLLIADAQTWKGEWIEGNAHSRLTLNADDHGIAAGLAMADGVRLVEDVADGSRLWDCSDELFKGKAECTVYRAPQGFPRSGAVSMTDDECGIGMHRGDRIWLVRRNARTEELLDADGIAQCSGNAILLYRGRHLQYVRAVRQNVTSERRPLRLAVEPQTR
jgi:hypothetical protein